MAIPCHWVNAAQGKECATVSGYPGTTWSHVFFLQQVRFATLGILTNKLAGITHVISSNMQIAHKQTGMLAGITHVISSNMQIAHKQTWETFGILAGGKLCLGP